MRARRARPRDQAVLELNAVKRTEGEDSWAVRTVGCSCYFSLSLSLFFFSSLDSLLFGKNTYVDTGRLERCRVHGGR